MNVDTLPINIKKRMKDLHLTAYAVEKKTGIKKSTIHNILLRRVKSPTIDTVYAIAKALNCSVADLVEEQDVGALFVENKSGYLLNWRLYIDTLVKVGILLSKSGVETDRNKIYEVIEEVYQYSLKASKQSMDRDFAEWAVHKLLAKK